MDDHEIFERLVAIFMPQAALLREELNEKGQLLAHYTTAENALRILKGQQIWLRNVRFMNDFSEVQHGLGMLRRFFAPNEPDIGRADFISALNAIQPNLVEQVINKFNGIIGHIENQTYITCLSMHHQHENEIGRLSMWRGYGRGAAPVALVIRTHTMARFTDALGVFSTPVIYQDRNTFFEVMRTLPARVRANEEFLREVDINWLSHMLFQTLIAYSISQKHRGFAEEQEWRMLHILGHHNIGVLEQDVESVSGSPQNVLKLKLENPKEIPDIGISVPELLERIIVGPCEFPDGIAEGFVKVLEKLGVKDAADRVTISDTPLRT
ncbi:hypothetical protein WH87_09775 [Devosia epidermidihirudinis]|uniref:DUF2971 domain-containing protein n=1 Tax=Devosia epidermidihirudinis TaxID=1293439 RepID=A0A0F5QAB3_9HYPH|nr:DUF2971 domain-containing protein [Devosia epidermidihirudinis]KKC37937.1 hypothetical protein WH87_09775 [Devosia epidermidihirudinis]